MDRLGNVAVSAIPIVFGEPRFWVALALLPVGFCIKIDGRPRKMTSCMFGVTGALAVTFLLYMFISSLWSVGVGTVYSSFIVYKAYETGMLLVVVLATVSVCRDADPVELQKGLWTGILAFCFLLAAAGIIGYGSGRRLAVFGGGPNVFGRNMALMCIGCLMAANAKGKYILWLILCSIGGALIILSGSRGALLSAVLSVGSTFFLMRVKWHRKIFIGICGLLLSAIILQYTPIGLRTMDVFRSRVINLTFEQEHTSGRSELLEQAIKIGSEHMYVGVGLGGYIYVTGSNYPHNLFLEAFSEGGSIGLALLVGTIGIFVINSWRDRKLIDPFLAGAFILFFIASQFSGSLFDSRSVFIFLILASIPGKQRWESQMWKRPLFPFVVSKHSGYRKNRMMMLRRPL